MDPLHASTPDTQATILLAESDPNLSFLLEASIRNSNYQIVSIASENEVARALAKNRIDLILLDLMIPHRDQFTLCQFIRHQYNIPIVLLSSSRATEANLSAQYVGADAYLRKPMRLSELHHCIHSLLKP